MYYINSATHVYENKKNNEVVAFFDADTSYDLHFILGLNVVLVIKPEEMSESYIDFLSTQDYEDELETMNDLVTSTDSWEKTSENIEEVIHDS
jgi:hypothetical protein